MSEIFLIEFLVIMFILVAVLFGLERIAPSKSKQYRESLSDMYVAGKIKQIAKKDGLDLNAEFLDFAKVMKDKRINYESLDATVERELQEKLTEDKKGLTEEKKGKTASKA